MEIIVSKNCGPAMFFRDLLEYLLVGRRDETGKYIFGLCFTIGPADTGRPPREPEGGGGGADELGRQEGGTVAGPQGTLLSQQKMEGKDEGNTYLSTSPSTTAPKNWMNW